jgi:hypothetical protein
MKSEEFPKLFSEEETKNQRPEFSLVLEAIKKWYRDNGKEPVPLYTLEGETIHPKLKNIEFYFWTVPEIGEPNRPEQIHPLEDFIAVETRGIDSSKYQSLLNRVFKSFNEAKFELGQTAKAIFENEEANKNEPHYSKAA